MNPQRAKNIITDEDFTALVTQVRDQLTAKVMALSTSDEDRAAALSEAHALDRLTGRLRSVANNVTPE